MQTDDFVQEFLYALDKTFGDRVWFCGLQGSRARGDNREDSDVDMVVILDDLTADDIAVYSDMVRRLAEPELACGFLGGRAELENWDPADLLHLCCDTRPLRGSLVSVRERISRRALVQSAWSSGCAIYHGCVHNMLYEMSTGILRQLLKNAKFVIQTQICADTGQFPAGSEEMHALADAGQRSVLELFAAAKDGADLPFMEASRVVFSWAQNVVRSRGGIR